MSAIQPESARILREIAGDLNKVLPRRIWIEGDGRIYCDGPGNIQRKELNDLDLIKLVHSSSNGIERILIVA